VLILETSKKFTKLIILILVFLLIIPFINVKAERPYNRIEGKDRYDTALKVSQIYSSNLGYVILASGKDYADGLCASPLARKYNAPIFLTDPKNLSNSVLEQIKKLGTNKIFIIGGYGSVCENIENQLKQEGLNCERISGKDRYETSLNIAKHIGVKDKLIVASAKNFPDALSIAPIATMKQIPILITNGQDVSDNMLEYLKDKNIEKTYVIGGTGVIDESVLNKFNNAERISGKNRYETNIAVINKFKDELSFENVYIVSALGFADALSGSVLVQSKNAPLLLIGDNISKNDQENIKSILSESKNVNVIGGKGAVSQNSLYLVGIEKKPIVQPSITESFNVINAGETTPVYIKKYANYNSPNVGYSYGSLAEVKIIGNSGDFYHIETLDYGTLNRVKGYLPKKMIKTVTPSKTYKIFVDLNKQKVYVYKDNKLIRQMVCSTGKDETPTPRGRYLLGGKGANFYSSPSVICYNWSRFNNNFLFHSVLYNTSGKPIASEYAKLGKKASHGCIRLKIEDAKWIYNNAPKGTLITIK
jgi:putative cell wall-binding protein/lipoprotein-anchoring transpeptidase ErfK/SrfK